MALRAILEFPDPRLRTRAQPVTRFDAALGALVEDLLETMYAAPGIGLAATQVDVHQRVIVIDISAEHNQPLVLINPQILSREGEANTEEGCLSVPGIFDDVMRAAKIRVFDTALDAVADVVAGHSDVGAITAASAVPELEASRLRAIAISSPTRLPGPYAAAPTWIEQSIDCVVGSWRGASGPPELGGAETAFWQAVLAAATQTKEWKADLERHFWTEMYLDGAELQQYLKRELTDMRAVLSELGLLAGGG